MRGLVATHHGFIDIQTEVGRGTTFRVFLPAAEGSLPKPVSASPFSLTESQGELILLVDDDEPIRNAVCTVLEKHGYRVAPCSDGIEALSLFASRLNEFALIVTDVDMPHASGVVLARAVLQLRPDIKIMAMSGLTQGGNTGSNWAEMQKLAQAFLAKPFTAEDLLSAVHQLLHPAAKA